MDVEYTMEEIKKLVHMCEHPVLKHKVTQLRRTETSSKHFRELLREITMYMGYEATRDLKTKELVVETPLATHTGVELAYDIGLVPVLRSGLGMVEPMLDILTTAQVLHIGMYRSKESLLPVLYYDKLPSEMTVDRAIVLEPLIATSGTLSAVIDILKDRGLDDIHVISVVASRTGISKLLKMHPTIQLHIVAIDDTLNEDGLIVPGVGDVGDRLFNTKPTLHNDSSNKKRKM